MSQDLIDVASLEPLFRPRSVAVIGASSSAEKIGGRPVDFLKKHNFDGAILPINPNAAVIQDLPAYASLLDAPGDIDLAICAVPGPLVAQAVADCVAKGVKGLVMFSAGFAEVSEEGRLEQERLAAQARAAGMRMMGPNCMGAANLATGMIASFHPGFDIIPPGEAKIGLVSQSGAFGGLSAIMAQDRGIPLRYVLTTGNEADVEASDCLAFLAEDPDTEVIMLYLEGCRNGPKLLQALDLARRNRKKVVAIKVGRTEAGANAAQSHTAALAGADQIFDAVFKQFGVYRAQNIAEFFDVGCAAAIAPLPKNDRIGLVTVSGGVGVLMADDAAARGLDVAEMPAETQARMKELVPFAGVRNPLDVTGQVLNDRTLYEQAVKMVLEQGDYGSLLCFQGSVNRLPERTEAQVELWGGVRAAYPDKLIVISGLNRPEMRQRIEALGCPLFAEPTDGIRVIAALTGMARELARPWQRPHVAPAPAPLPAGNLTEVEAMSYLAQAGVPVIEERLARSADEAAAAALDFGRPLVMKVVSRQIVHKSDVGGVKLNVDGPSQARVAYDTIIDSVSQWAPDAVIEGCLLAPMAGGGIETILGVTQDPVFGPVIMFGLGGVFVEVLEDVTFRVAPFDEAEAHRMIREIKGFKILEGVRGQPPSDLDALATALARLSEFAAAHGDQIVAMEANPFLVQQEGYGALALDAVLEAKAK